MGRQENLDKREGALCDELNNLALALQAQPSIPSRLREASDRIAFLQAMLNDTHQTIDRLVGERGEARHAADHYRSALRRIAMMDQHPVSYSSGPKMVYGRYARVALEALDELDKIETSTADAVLGEFGSRAGAEEKSTDEASAIPIWARMDKLTPLDPDMSHPVIKVILEGIAARDSGANSPYPGNTLEHSLHAFGWVQRDLRLAWDACKARSLDPDKPLRNAAYGLLQLIDTVQKRRMPGVSAPHGIYSPGSPMADKVEELRKLVNAEPAQS